jgi:hypothetical protein
MILNLFRKNTFGNLILLILIILSIWVPWLIDQTKTPLIFDDQLKMPLYQALLYFINRFPLYSDVLGILLIFTVSILLTRQNKDFLILEGRSYYLPLFFVLISGSYLPLIRIYPALIASLFLILAVNRIFTSYHDLKIGNYFFDAGVLISIGSLFYFPLIFLGIMLFVGIILLRPIHLREWILSIVGLFMPYLFTWSFYFLTDQSTLFFNTLRANSSLDNQFQYLDLSHYLLYSFLFLLAIPSGLVMMYQSGTRKVSTRKFLRFHFWLTIFAALVMFLIPSIAMQMLPILGIPLSYLYANYFYTIKKSLLGNILLTVIFILLINVHLFHLYKDFFRLF